MARSARYLADKVVDVLVYIVISSVIASIPYLILPTLSPGLVFLTVAVAATIAMILVYLLAPYVERLLAKRRNATGLDERFMPNLMALARAQYKYVLGLNIRLIGQDLDTKLSPRITTWDDVDPEFKKRLVTDEAEYDALEDFSKSLRQRGDNLHKPDFDVYDKLCKAHYERLNMLGLVTESSKPSSPIPSKSPLRFQGIYGTDELLKLLENIEAKGHQWQALIEGVPKEEDAWLVSREVSNYRTELFTLGHRYTNAWDASLHTRVNVIDDQLADSFSELGKNRIDWARARIETALENVKVLIAYLKSPTSG